MGELTPEQQKALALAKARRRRKEAEGGAAAPAATATAPAAPAAAPAPALPGPATPMYADGDPRNVATEVASAAEPDTWGGMANGLLAALGDGTRQGMSMLAGAPVDLINNAPRLLNLLPGEQGVTAFTENPVGGREMVDSILRGGGLIDDYQPRNGAERIVNRVGEEIGAGVVPTAGVIAKAKNMPLDDINRMVAAPKTTGEGIAGQFLQPAAVNPAGLAAKETYYATAAGAGAGTATEMFGDGPMTDMGGSLAGVLAAALGSGLTGAVGNLVSGMTGSPKFVDDVAQSAVAERIMNASSDLQEQAARLVDAGIDPKQLSTDRLVGALRSPAAVEEAVPGYRANIADRTQDPGLATFAYAADSNSPGAAAARRTSNETVVNDRMTGMAPEGDPGRFRTDLQTGVDAKIGEAQAVQEGAQGGFDNIVQALQPIMREASARGSSIRSALADAYGTAQDKVRDLYEPINQSDAPVDIGPLREVFSEIDSTLPLNDRTRFRPGEADVAQQLEGEVPLREVTSMRSGLTDDTRVARATGKNQAARVGDQYVEALDRFTDDAIPPALRAALDEARTARRDVGDRFERPGTALDAILGKREGGGYAMDDSAVPAKIAQPDQGKLSDLKSALSEAGTDPRLRDGLADEVRSDVTTRGLLDNPTALGKYMADRQVLLGEFPELRAQLEEAGVSKATLAAAEKTAAETTKRLTTPGRSAEASYLKNVEDPAAAIRSVVANPDPRKAVADLVATANTPQAKADLRAALWEEVKRTGKMEAPGTTGETRWNGKKLKAMFEDPKFKAVAEELWADDPEDLANIKTVFDALAGAEGSSRARVPGSSGTAQALSGKLDPALTASSLASRARSVSRGQLSPVIAVVDVLGTWLRRRSAQVQSRAIDAITAAVVNNPGLAADLLEKYNPATAAARRKMLTQKYGVRATTVLNIIEEAEEEDPVLDAVEDK